jgi:hypothetical protein
MTPNERELIRGMIYLAEVFEQGMENMWQLQFALAKKGLVTGEDLAEAAATVEVEAALEVDSGFGHYLRGLRERIRTMREILGDG